MAAIRSSHLSFGIERILPDIQHGAEHHSRSREKNRFQQSLLIKESSSNARNLEAEIDKASKIVHLYGKESGIPLWNHNPFQMGPAGFCTFGFGWHQGMSDAAFYEDLGAPAAVQRVPMSISFRQRCEMGAMEGHSPESEKIVSTGKQGKKKKAWTRAVFTSLQRKGLERSFVAQQYIGKKDRRKLAATLGLTDSQVRIWYANRRMKAKKRSTPGSNMDSSIN